MLLSASGNTPCIDTCHEVHPKHMTGQHYRDESARPLVWEGCRAKFCSDMFDAPERMHYLKEDIRDLLLGIVDHFG